MKLKVVREIFTQNSTIGRLYIDGTICCYTLEDVVREVPGKPVSYWKIPNETAIPYGIYKVVIDFSEHFQRMLPHILNVPGFDGVRIHKGNTAADTEGCLLVGMNKLPDDIFECQPAYDIIVDKITGSLGNNEQVTIEYVNVKDLPETVGTASSSGSTKVEVVSKVSGSKPEVILPPSEPVKVESKPTEDEGFFSTFMSIFSSLFGKGK